MTTLDEVVATLDDYAVEQNQLLADANARAANAAAQVQALQDEIDATPKPRPATVFGATPAGSQNTAGLTAADGKYGHVGVARIFWRATPGPTPDPTRRIVGSCKQAASDQLQAAWQAAMWRWTLLHEIDVKLAKGTSPMSLADWKTGLGRLLGLPGGNPAASTIILSAWTFNPKAEPPRNPDDYWVEGVQHLGVDFDGWQPNSLPDLTVMLANVTAFAAKHGVSWGVAEFGCDVDRTFDPDGSKRAVWLGRWARSFEQAGAEYVCLWELTGEAGSLLTTPAELAVWRSLL